MAKKSKNKKPLAEIINNKPYCPVCHNLLGTLTSYDCAEYKDETVYVFNRQCTNVYCSANKDGKKQEYEYMAKISFDKDNEYFVVDEDEINVIHDNDGEVISEEQ